MRQIQADILSKLTSLEPTPRAVLDIGCGVGAFTRIMASALRGTHFTAVDPKLSEQVESAGRIAYARSKVEALFLESNSFDAVVASMSFHHWADKQAGIHEAFRVLKPGGYLIIGDPFFEGIMRNRFMAWLLQVTDGGKFTTFDDFETYLRAAAFGPMEALPVASSFGTMFVVSAQKPA